ncbi:hypothetical protein ABVT39_010709 [Epinephelus coioides]
MGDAGGEVEEDEEKEGDEDDMEENRRVVDQSEDPRCGLKEIKCPDKNACKACPYLIQNADEDLALKVDQMGITGAK